METKDNAMAGDIRLRLVVEGDIQGVGYRALVKYIARNLKIRGFVRNLPDGTVEVFCEGSKECVEKFKRQICRKSTGSAGGLFSVNVENISESEIEKLPKEMKTFDVEYEENEAKTPFEKTNLERLEIGSLLLTDFRDSTRSKFDVMENKYGDISGQMVKIEGNISKLTKEFVKSNKNNARLVETLVSKLDKVIK